MRFILFCISFIIKVILFFIATGLGMVLSYIGAIIFVEVFYANVSGKDHFIEVMNWLPFIGAGLGFLLFIYFLRLFNAVSKSWFKYGFNRDGNKKE